MAKPPNKGTESDREYEARLLREGWYEDRPAEQRREAEQIAKGYGCNKSAAPRFLKTFALCWMAGAALVVAVIAVLTGLHYLFKAGYEVEASLFMLVTMAAAGAAWDETRRGEE